MSQWAVLLCRLSSPIAGCGLWACGDDLAELPVPRKVAALARRKYCTAIRRVRADVYVDHAPPQQLDLTHLNKFDLIIAFGLL